jgi:hypothetical protein
MADRNFSVADPETCSSARAMRNSLAARLGVYHSAALTTAERHWLAVVDPTRMRTTSGPDDSCEIGDALTNTREPNLDSFTPMWMHWIQQRQHKKMRELLRLGKAIIHGWNNTSFSIRSWRRELNWKKNSRRAVRWSNSKIFRQSWEEWNRKPSFSYDSRWLQKNRQFNLHADISVDKWLGIATPRRTAVWKRKLSL